MHANTDISRDFAQPKSVILSQIIVFNYENDFSALVSGAANLLVQNRKFAVNNCRVGRESEWLFFHGGNASGMPLCSVLSLCALLHPEVLNLTHSANDRQSSAIFVNTRFFGWSIFLKRLHNLCQPQILVYIDGIYREGFFKHKKAIFEVVRYPSKKTTETQNCHLVVFIIFFTF